MPIGAFAQDIITRIINVHWEIVAEQQGLLVTDASSSPIAVALDSGETFPGITMGASSATFTVLAEGVVVYGKPEDGDACFMACVDGVHIRRGTRDSSKTKITWSEVYTAAAGIAALSFAGGAFFVTYLADGPRSPSRCAASIDGLRFTEIGNLYNGVPFSLRAEQVPGSVAYNGKHYAAVGVYDMADPDYRSSGDFNMMWAKSEDGHAWTSGYTSAPDGNPGIGTYAVNLGDGAGVAFSNVAGGDGLFVAAATSRIAFQFSADTTLNVVVPAAAAAVSATGNSWTTVPLPAAFPAIWDPSFKEDSSSLSLSVAYVRAGKSAKPGQPQGYFLISGGGFSRTEGAKSWCWKGSGDGWTMIKTGPDFGAVSAIAKDLNSTTIVYLRR